MIKPKIYRTEKQWLRARTGVVTATEASSLFSLNPYQSAAKMWKRKLVPDFQENAYTFTGKVLEPAVVNAVNLLTESDFKLFGTDEGTPFFIHPEHKLGATPDAIIRREPGKDSVLLECKTTSPTRFEDWEEKPPYYYILQAHVQMLCTGLSRCVLACLPTDMTPEYYNAPFPIHMYVIDHHDELEEVVFSTVDRFWEEPEEFKVDRSDARKVKKWLLDSMTKVEI